VLNEIAPLVDGCGDIDWMDATGAVQLDKFVDYIGSGYCFDGRRACNGIVRDERYNTQ
jgi:hypothetical protein